MLRIFVRLDIVYGKLVFSVCLLLSLVILYIFVNVLLCFVILWNILKLYGSFCLIRDFDVNVYVLVRNVCISFGLMLIFGVLDDNVLKI